MLKEPVFANADELLEASGETLRMVDSFFKLLPTTMPNEVVAAHIEQFSAFYMAPAYRSGFGVVISDMRELVEFMQWAWMIEKDLQPFDGSLAVEEMKDPLTIEETKDKDTSVDPVELCSLASLKEKYASITPVIPKEASK